MPVELQRLQEFSGVPERTCSLRVFINSRLPTAVSLHVYHAAILETMILSKGRWFGTGMYAAVGLTYSVVVGTSSASTGIIVTPTHMPATSAAAAVTAISAFSRSDSCMSAMEGFELSSPRQ